MAYPLIFDKDQAAYFVARLAAGEPIEGARRVHEMLTLAGACLFAASSHGPPQLDPAAYAALPAEHQEATGEQLHRDITAVVEICAALAHLVHDDEFDAAYGPRVVALVYAAGDTKHVLPIAGFRGLQGGQP